jgi:hypothetical protein
VTARGAGRGGPCRGADPAHPISRPSIASVFTLSISEAVGLTPLSLGSVPLIRHVAPPLSLFGPDFMGAGRLV